MNIVTLPQECQLHILSNFVQPCRYLDFPAAIEDSFTALSKISLVCSNWRNLQPDNTVWQPVFNRFAEELTFEVYFPPGATYIDKVKRFMLSLRNSKSLMIDCLMKTPSDTHTTNTFYIGYFSRTPVLYFLNYLKTDLKNTESFIKLIQKGELELLAKLLLFRPDFKASEIALELAASPNKNTKAEVAFVFNLMIKLNYKMSALFKTMTKGSPHFPGHSALNSVFFSFCGEIKISDFIASGCSFARVESTTPDFSVLHDLLPHFKAFYQKGVFEVPHHNHSKPVFYDRTLRRHIRKDPASENDLEEFILDLLTKAGLDLDIFCPEKDELEKGTALSQLRQLAILLPKGNAIKQALDAYDKRETR
jgi:hypothetical protein